MQNHLARHFALNSDHRFGKSSNFAWKIDVIAVRLASGVVFCRACNDYVYSPAVLENVWSQEQMHATRLIVYLTGILALSLQLFHKNRIRYQTDHEAKFIVSFIG